MSSELLINFDKSDTKNLSSSSTNNKSSNNEKKEGTSLFDSLMTQAKNDSSTETETKEQPITKKQNDSSTETETKEQSATKTGSKNKENNLNKEDKVSTEIAKSSDTSNKEVSTPLKKMIDRLVDIIVSSAKEIKDAKSSKGSLQSEVVKDKINQLLENKNINTLKIDELKTEVSKIIKDVETKDLKAEVIKNAVSKVLEENSVKNGKSDIAVIKDKVNNIKESVKTISSTNKEIMKDLENISDAKNTEKIENSKNTIKNEVSTIKDNIKELKEGIEKSPKEEIKNLNTTVNGKLENIDKSAEEISSSVGKVKIDKKAVIAKEVKEIPQKLEYQVEQLKENISTVEEEITKVIIVKTTENISENKLNETTKIVKNSSSEIINKDDKNPLLASMFLQSQKSTKETTSLEQIKNAKDTILNKKTIESVKEGAKKLDLGLEETEVKNEGESDKKVTLVEPKKEELRNNNINNRFLNQAILKQKFEDSNQNAESLRVIKSQKELSSSIERELEVNSGSKEKTSIVELSVPRDVIQNLQTKIIGAQQKLSGFMSEVARNMYLNYKPPVTAFRVNLNPANLGSISIIMKANKIDNSLTVSMNLSNSNTMESFVENKAMLQNAIQKQFSESSNVSIDFGMQNQNSENSFNQFNQNNNQNSNQNNEDSDMTNENTEEEQEIANNDYM